MQFGVKIDTAGFGVVDNVYSLNTECCEFLRFNSTGCVRVIGPEQHVTVAVLMPAPGAT